MPPQWIPPGQTVDLTLTRAQRDLICDLPMVEDQVIDRLAISDTAKQAIPFTLDELDDLAGHVAAEANHTPDKRRQRALDRIFKKIERMLGQYTDQDDTHDEVKAIETEEQALAALVEMANTLGHACEAAGVDFESVLDQMQPETIRPDDEVEFSVTAKERSMMLELEELDDDIRIRLEQVPGNKRKIVLPFSQIEWLAGEVDDARLSSVDKKEFGRWQQLLDKLEAVQLAYIPEDELNESLNELLADSSKSALRNLLARMIESRAAEEQESSAQPSDHVPQLRLVQSDDHDEPSGG
ncbi:MAG: hypothetical protein QGH33_08085 [Pirellulaceae bacterium]|jgi:hypothetical protein|nr:hypothetical protein [Pirellulaceae bacterium]